MSPSPPAGSTGASTVISRRSASNAWRKSRSGDTPMPASSPTILIGSWPASQSWPGLRNFRKNCGGRPGGIRLRRLSWSFWLSSPGRFWAPDPGLKAVWSQVESLTAGYGLRCRDRTQAVRHARYVADIRQAFRYVQDHRSREADELLARIARSPARRTCVSFAWYHLWHRNHTERRTLTGHRGDVYYVEFSPRGDLLASAGKDGTVLIWDTSRWQLVRKIEPRTTEVNVAAFSPDGKTIATVDDDGKLKLWEIATGHCQLEGSHIRGMPSSPVFTSDGKTIVTGGRNDGFVKIWDPNVRAMLDSFRAGDSLLENAIFSPDGSSLATVGAGGVKLWKWPARTLIVALTTGTGTPRGRPSQTTEAGWQPHTSEQTARSGSGSSGGRLLHEVRGTRRRRQFSVAFSTDDRTIMSASGNEAIRLWDAATGSERSVHVGHSGQGAEPRPLSRRPHDSLSRRRTARLSFGTRGRQVKASASRPSSRGNSGSRRTAQA